MIEQEQYVYEVGQDRNGDDHADDVGRCKFLPDQVNGDPAEYGQQAGNYKGLVVNGAVKGEVHHRITVF